MQELNLNPIVNFHIFEEELIILAYVWNISIDTFFQRRLLID